MSTRSTDGSFGKLPSLMSCSARPVSPTLPEFWAWFVPAMLPTTMAAVTNTTHSAMARHGCVALQRAILTVSGLRSTVVISSPCIGSVEADVRDPGGHGHPGSHLTGP